MTHFDRMYIIVVFHQTVFSLYTYHFIIINDFEEEWQIFNLLIC